MKIKHTMFVIYPDSIKGKEKNKEVTRLLDALTDNADIVSAVNCEDSIVYIIREMVK